MAETRPLTREQVREALGLVGDIATLVGENVIHCEALTILSKLQGVEATLLSVLDTSKPTLHLVPNQENGHE